MTPERLKRIEGEIEIAVRVRGAELGGVACALVEEVKRLRAVEARLLQAQGEFLAGSVHTLRVLGREMKRLCDESAERIDKAVTDAG